MRLEELAGAKTQLAEAEVWIRPCLQQHADRGRLGQGWICVSAMGCSGTAEAQSRFGGVSL